MQSLLKVYIYDGNRLGSNFFMPLRLVVDLDDHSPNSTLESLAISQVCGALTEVDDRF